MNAPTSKKVAVLATSGFEQSELKVPAAKLREAGVEAHIVAPQGGQIRAWRQGEWSDEVAVDRTLDEAETTDYDALVLPGGVINPDTLRQDGRAIAFIQAMHADGKPVAAICHGPWLLAEADLLRGRRATSYPSIKTDLVNAGCEWIDREVVTGGGLITSRKPADLDAFCGALLEALADPAKAA